MRGIARKRRGNGRRNSPETREIATFRANGGLNCKKRSVKASATSLCASRTKFGVKTPRNEDGVHVQRWRLSRLRLTAVRAGEMTVAFLFSTARQLAPCASRLHLFGWLLAPPSFPRLLGTLAPSPTNVGWTCGHRSFVFQRAPRAPHSARAAFLALPRGRRPAGSHW